MRPPTFFSSGVSVFFLTATLSLFQSVCAQTNGAPVTNGVAVVGEYVSTNRIVDIQRNYFMFLERVQHPWSCYFSGNGGYVQDFGDALGLNLNPIRGADVLTKLASPPYQCQIGMYISADMDSAYYAALNGLADFEPLYYANSHKRVDLRDDGQILGMGPPTWISVSSGFSTSTNAELPWGPQLEFIDTIRDITDPYLTLAISFCAGSTAARYANLKYLRPDWNVFDLRQGLRQASTFYNPNGGGWREEGGYGFPLVPNQIGDSFPVTSLTTNSLGLDGGPPLQPLALGKCGPNGPQLAFRWYNFRQSTFHHTRIKVGNIILDADANNSTYNWDVGSLWPLTVTNAEFFTVLTDGRTSPPETYTRVPIPPVIAEPRFNSESEFQFSIYSFPCNNFSNRYAHVYFSSDLHSWTLMQPYCLPDGKGVFKDSKIAGVSYRYYRLVQGDLHSQSIGFTRLAVPAGKSALIANQFDYSDNSLPKIFAFSTLPSPITVTKRDPAEQSAYDPTTGKWSNPGLKLSPGEAAWLNNSGSNSCIVSFVGDIREGALVNPIPSGSPILSLMLPIPFSSYGSYVRLGYETDPLGAGATMQLWDGQAFVNYYHDWTGWFPQNPPLQPGQGFSLNSSFPIPQNQSARWEIAYSALAPNVYTNPLFITGIRIEGIDVVISFTTMPAELYSLEMSEGDTGYNRWWDDLMNIIQGTGQVISVRHVNGAINHTARIYRIRDLGPNP